jgi:hypothetical protein
MMEKRISILINVNTKLERYRITRGDFANKEDNFNRQNYLTSILYWQQIGIIAFLEANFINNQRIKKQPQNNF